MDKIQRVLQFCSQRNFLIQYISEMDQDVTVFVIFSLYGQHNCAKVFISYLGENINLNSCLSSAPDQPCAVNNGNCSHLCLLTPGGGRKCACPQGIDLSDNGTTCANGKHNKTI